MNIDEKIKVAEINLERLLSFIRNVDNKCILLLGINTAMLGVIANFASMVKDWTMLSASLTISTTLILSVSLISTFWGSYPLTKSPPNSKISFEGITSLTLAEFEHNFLNLTKENHLKDIIQQCYKNAELNVKKYNRLKVAYLFLLFGSISWIFNIYLFKTG